MGHVEEQAGTAVIVVHLPCESRLTATVMMIPVRYTKPKRILEQG